MNIAFLFAIISTLLIFIILLCYVFIKALNASHRKKVLINNVCQLPLKPIQIEYLVDTVNRAKTFYIAYILHSSLSFLCRLLSAIFTVCGFFMTNVIGHETEQQILSILSVFFVLLSVYLIPKDRSKQYLLAWRKLDNHILSLILMDYKALSKAEIECKFTSSNAFRNELENSLKNDEDQ